PKLLYIICGLLIVIAGVVMLFFGSLPDISKKATARMASRDLGVAVEIGALDVDPAQAVIHVRDIVIDNPAGYKKSPALTVAAIDIKLRQLQPALISFEDMNVQGARIHIETKDETNNLAVLKAHMDEKD